MLRTVQVQNGLLRGLVGRDPRVAVFRGVPYAKPPVGDLRWRAPQPMEDWEGVRTCYEYGDMPMMRVHPGYGDDFYTRELHPIAAHYSMSEDCLYLNIYTPAASEQDNLPVFYYVHGGGLQDGYSYEIEFDPERVARRGVVVVMIGYRLGLFGFLAHPDITARTPENEPISNFGFQDQSLALHWVRDNIAAFGGNPEKITICGQSAGAGSVQAQLLSPYNSGLIAGAICQSGISMAFGDEARPFGGAMPLADAEAYGVRFLDTIGVRSLEEAQSMDAKVLMDKLFAISPGWAWSFGQCIDGRFVLENPWEAYFRDHVPNVPMMVGYCQGETAGMMTALPRATQGFCQLRAEHGQSVYHYIFDHDIPGDDAGSFHGSDLWFMFDSLGNSWRPFAGKHYDLARQVVSYWVNFVKTGDPNGLDYNGNPLPVWEPYTLEHRAAIRFVDVPVPEQLPEDPAIAARLVHGKQVFCGENI